MITLGVQVGKGVYKVSAHGFYFEDDFCVINCINGESIINSWQLVLGCTAEMFDKSKAKNCVE